MDMRRPISLAHPQQAQREEKLGVEEAKTGGNARASASDLRERESVCVRARVVERERRRGFTEIVRAGKFHRWKDEDEDEEDEEERRRA